jgi:hypothetical protein
LRGAAEGEQQKGSSRRGAAVGSSRGEQIEKSSRRGAAEGNPWRVAAEGE